MRDIHAEEKWINHPIIGYVPLDTDGKPFQPKIGRGRHERTKPITIYKTMARASNYSPIQSATEVRMFQPIEVN